MRRSGTKRSPGRKDCMKEIFDLQWKLNVATLGNIGLDFERTIRDPGQKPVWIENYRKALSSELAETIREVDEFGIGTQNGKIEIVDMLHFLVSLSHIVDIAPAEVRFGGEPKTGESFLACAVRTFLALDDLQSSVKWKWWAKGGGFKAEKAAAAVRELWECFDAMCGVFGLDFETVKRIYIEKNRVNFIRQERNYSEDTKTEADNRSITVEDMPGTAREGRS